MLATMKLRPPPKQTAMTRTITILAILALTLHTFTSPPQRRSLRSSTVDISISDAKYLHRTDSTLPPWAHFNLMSVHTRPTEEGESAIFWHIPKCGGTTAKRFYGDCLHFTLASRLGASPKFGHDTDTSIQIFQPFPSSSQTLVNVDTTTQEGIRRASQLGLAQSGLADMIFTSDINYASKHLFDRLHKGRVFAFFRHPVDRLVSKFYYLQTATWENTYRPEWKDLTLLEWARDHNSDENHMVKKILGKKLNESVEIGDLIVAKEIVRHKFFVGMMDDMEESIRRFNTVLGVDNANEETRACFREYFGDDQTVVQSHVVEGEGDRVKADDKKNSHAHPKVQEGSPEYELLAERNSLDMILYNYIELLFRQQKNIIEGFRNWKTVAVE